MAEVGMSGVYTRHALSKGELKFPAPSGRYYKLDGCYIDYESVWNIILAFITAAFVKTEKGWTRTTSRRWPSITARQKQLEKVRILEEASSKQ